MKCFIITILGFFLIGPCFSQEIQGTYKSVDGNTLIITNYEFKLNDTTDHFIIGNKTGRETYGSMVRYYIKPTYVKTDKKISVINLLLQNSDNALLGMRLFYYDIDSGILTMTVWDAFTNINSTEQFIRQGQ